MKPDVDDAQAFCHREVVINGYRWHFVDEGAGPLVILLHGFPYTWFAYRKLIPLLVSAGHRVVAPDLLGFGGSDAPAGAEPYTHVRGVGDLVALLQTVNEREAVLVGHDVGASLAFAAAQMRPDRFAALVLLNTPAAPRPARRPSQTWLEMQAQTGATFYQAYFAGEGAVAELDADIRCSLRSIMFSVSGDAEGVQRWRPFIAPNEGFLDTVCDPPQLPGWLPVRALDVYAAAYARHGFRGALGAYRSRELNWEQGAFLDGLRPAQPCLFVGGADDPAAERLRPAYDALQHTLPGLCQKLLLHGVGHCVAEEAHEALAQVLLPFLAAVHRCSTVPSK